MADETENEFEEEFDFESDEDLLGGSEEEIGEESATDEFDYGGGESKKPPMPVLIGAGVAVLVVIIIVIMMMSGDDEPPPPPPVELSEPEPSPIVQDPWGGTGDLLAEGEERITPKDVVEKIEAQDATYKKYMQGLDRKLNELMSKLGRLEQRLGASNQAVAEVSHKLEAINQEMKMMAAPPPVVEQPKEEVVDTQAFVNPTLTVHAIIPGRAWLKTREGKTITVTEGDAVEGYGKVLAIDAPSNKVITSSGVVLR